MNTIIIDHKAKSRKLSFYDNPNAHAIIKIGKEIKLFKEKDGHRYYGKEKAREIERRFGKDANALIKPKEDRNLCRDLTRDINRDLRREFQRSR
jgi:hypothetical protein